MACTKSRVVHSVHENSLVARTRPVRSRLLAALVMVVPDPGKRRTATDVGTDFGAGHQKLIELLESEMSV